ncbi:hypothetical protein NA57DRAFT_70176 [Rhizodiscina lignyota]|uniref:DUF3445 domain-containing protein n=1 Tax=Rhizodiscina lignyota TaxID=1504668 RepID=A0A9P4IRC6_9PEZI|nr:hypothetical protein NA57DRAFT_70176 [Rhizodiscina lignyota]
MSLTLAIVLLLLAISLLFSSKVTNWKPLVEQWARGTATQPLDVECLKPNADFDIRNTEPRPYRPWRSGKFVMTMGIRKMPREDWLLLDNRYFEEQKLRRHLLHENRRGVFQALPGSEMACREVLAEIVAFLTRRYPQWFYCPTQNPDYVHNALTGRTFKVAEPYENHPLEVAAQLAKEDINLLIQGAGPDPNQFYLLASYSMAPAGWHLEERIGWSLMDLHETVPGWEEKLREPVERRCQPRLKKYIERFLIARSFFRRLKADAPVERYNYFLQTTDEFHSRALRNRI